MPSSSHHYAGAGTAPPAFVRSAIGDGSSVASASAVLGAAPSPSSQIVVVYASFTAAASSVSCTGATFVSDVARAANGAFVSIWRGTGATSATVTVNTSASSYFSFYAIEFSGLLASPFDVATSNPFTASPITPGSITPGASGELVVAGYGDYNNTTGRTGTPAGYTDLGLYVGSGPSLGCAYLVQAVAAATNPAWTYPTSPAGAAVIAAYKHA